MAKPPDITLSVIPAEIAVLDLKPGDMIMVRVPSVLSSAQRERIMRWLAEAFPGHTTALLDGGVELTIVRQPSGWGGGAKSPDSSSP